MNKRGKLPEIQNFGKFLSIENMRIKALHSELFSELKFPNFFQKFSQKFCEFENSVFSEKFPNFYSQTFPKLVKTKSLENSV